MSVVDVPAVSGLPAAGGTISNIHRIADSQPVLWVDRTKGWIVQEDYVNLNVTGSMNWAALTSGGGAAVSDGGVSGITSGINQKYHKLTTGTATNGYASLYTAGGASGDYLDIPATGMDFECYCRVRFEDLSDGTDTFNFAVGLFQNQITVAQTDAIHFNYDSSVGTNWMCETEDTGITATDSGITVAADTWYELFWRYSEADTNIKYYIDGTLVATNSTTANIPVGTTTNMMIAQKIIKSAGTTDRAVYTSGFQIAGYDAG